MTATLYGDRIDYKKQELKVDPKAVTMHKFEVKKDKNGYFDERFGMYYEDLDLCWRAQKKKWKAYYNPKAVAYHERGGTTVYPRSGSRLNFFFLPDNLKERYIRNRYRCIKKNDSLQSIFMNLPFIVLYEIKVWAYYIFSACKAAYKGCTRKDFA